MRRENRLTAKHLYSEGDAEYRSIGKLAEALGKAELKKAFIAKAGIGGGLLYDHALYLDALDRGAAPAPEEKMREANEAADRLYYKFRITADLKRAGACGPKMPESQRDLCQYDDKALKALDTLTRRRIELYNQSIEFKLAHKPDV